MLKRLTPENAWLRPLNFIGGKWIPAIGSGATVPVAFPAAPSLDTPPLGYIPQSGRADAQAAADAACAAFPAWADEVAQTRANLMRAFATKIREKSADLSELVAAESGKVLADAEGEVIFASTYFDWYAGEAERIYGMVLPPFRKGVRPFIIKRAIGPVAIITPWNNPIAMAARAAAGALAAGCTVVIKPSDLSPFATNALASIAQEIGIPAGVFNVVQSRDADAVASTWMDDPRVRKISFTGSVRVGKMLTAAAAKTMKRVSMELGGNAPFIIFEDGDVDKALEGFMSAKWRNSGQACICVNRLLVHESLAAEVTQKVVSSLSRYKLGNNITDASANFGPVISVPQRDRIHGLVEDARAKGATVLAGGQLSAVGPCFYPPTVVSNVNPSMRIFQEEIFGPAISIVTFKTDDEAIAIANNTSVGLAAYFFTKNSQRQWRLAEQLEYGMIGCNDGVIRSASIPFGGVKDSGCGHDGGPTGIANFIEEKYFMMGGQYVAPSKL
jgi:succinate-semialdehyde dehydrogenase/glutarate-semialdehyde dehydrogenase